MTVGTLQLNVEHPSHLVWMAGVLFVEPGPVGPPYYTLGEISNTVLLVNLFLCPLRDTEAKLSFIIPGFLL